MRKPGRILLLGLVVATIAALLFHFHFSPEARIDRAVAGAVKALETEDDDALDAFFHPDFKDAFNLDKDTWLSLVQYSWQHWKDVKIRLLQPEIAIQGDRATMRFNAIAEATAADSIGPGKIPRRETATRQKVELQLSRENGEWRLIGVGDLSPAEWGVSPQMVIQP